MLSNNPTPIDAVQSDEPPYERKKRGIPVIGIIPIAMPILTKKWKKTIPRIPETTYLEKLSFA